MRKKLSLLLCLVFVAFGVAACGESAEDAVYFGMAYPEWKANMEQEVAALVGLDEASKQSIMEYGSDIAINLVTTWDEATEGLGAYQGLGEFTVTKAQDTVTVEQQLAFEDRDVIVTYVYEYNYGTEQMDLIDANADLVYTLGEKMSKAGMNTLMGMGTVFCVLILISLIIYCFKLIPLIQAKFSGKKAPEPQARPSAPIPVAPPLPPQAEPEPADDTELVAVIAAAVAAAAGAPADSFVVRSIRRR